MGLLLDGTRAACVEDSERYLLSWLRTSTDMYPIVTRLFERYGWRRTDRVKYEGWQAWLGGLKADTLHSRSKSGTRASGAPAPPDDL